MSFEHPYFLCLLAVPAGLLLGGLLAAWRRSARGGNARILRVRAGGGRARLAAGAGRRRWWWLGGRWLLSAGLALVVVALARPQWGTEKVQVFDQAREILLAVDLSRSMDAEDVKPSRLERARLLVQQLLDDLDGERVGLELFAGTAFLQAPLSSDYEILREFLAQLSTQYLPEPGTNYSALLDVSLEAFGTDDADRFLIVLSDGEADPADPWREKAEELKKRGVRVIALGVGTADGAMLPDGADGFLKDERGAVVLSRLEPSTLQELARLTGGVYLDASRWVRLADVVKETVEAGRKGNFAEEKKMLQIERYQWFLAPGAVLLLLSLWFEFPVRPRARRVRLVAGRVAALCVLAGGALLLLSPLRAEEIAPKTPAAAARELSELVGKLSARPELSAEEIEALAAATVDYGIALREAGQPVVEGPLRDALAAIRREEKKDGARSERWQQRKRELEALLKNPEQRQPPPQSESPEHPQQPGGGQSPQRKDSDRGGENGGSGTQPQTGGASQKKPEPRQQQDGEASGQEAGSPEARQQSSSGQPQEAGDQPGRENQSSGAEENSGGQGSSGAEETGGGQNSRGGAGAGAQGKEKVSGAEENGGGQGSSGAEENGGGQNSRGPKRNRPAEGGHFFREMLEDPAEKKVTEPAATGARSPGKNAPQRTVGGVAADGVSLDGKQDAELLLPLQRLEEARKADQPGELFRRMQGKGGGTAGRKRTW